MLTVKEIEDKIRLGLKKHNLKLLPYCYYDEVHGVCCAIGAFNAADMEVLEKDTSMNWFNHTYGTPGHDWRLTLLEAQFMGWQPTKETIRLAGEDAEYIIQVGNKLREDSKLFYPDLFAKYCEEPVKSSDPGEFYDEY